MGRCFSRHVPALKQHLLSIPHAAAEHFREASVMSEAHMSEIAATHLIDCQMAEGEDYCRR